MKQNPTTTWLRIDFSRNTIFKSPYTLSIAMVGILLGIFYLFLLYRGDIERYYQEKYNNPAFVTLTKPPYWEVKIGYISDVHSITKLGKIYPDSLLPMKAFVEHTKVFQPDFVIQNGDFIDGTRRTENEGSNDFQTINAVFNQIQAPKYHVLGNHELRSFDKKKWLELTGYPSTYYHFDVQGYRIIVLDGNYIPHENWDEEVKPGRGYNRGYVSKEQMKWLESLLSDSKGRRKIVFIHQPPLQSTPNRERYTSFPAKGGQLREMFAKYKVKAVFSGHIEEKHHENVDGVDYYVMPGFFKDLNKQKTQGYAGVHADIIATRKEVQVTMYHRDLKSGEYQSEDL